MQWKFANQPPGSANQQSESKSSMSDNNELSLLEEDLDDDIDYGDLGNEDEDALLADDYDVQNEHTQQNQDGFHEYEEPLDDVLDLGVTDGLDDLESEIQDNVDESSASAKKQQVVIQDQFAQQTFSVKDDSPELQQVGEAQLVPIQNASYEVHTSTGDTHVQLESEEEEEGGEDEGEGRNRFKSERPNIVSLKSGKTYGNIPDSLDNVIPVDDISSQKQSHRRDGGQWRGRRGGRGGSTRGSMRPHFHQGPGFSAGIGRGGFVRHPLLPQQQQTPLPSQQQQQPPPHAPLQQPPHKILINPHFRGAVQPHPEARLIWDTDPSTQPCGDGLLPFPPRVFVDTPYTTAPQGNYEPPYQQHEPMHGGYGAMAAEPQQLPQPQPYYHDIYAEQPPPPPQQQQPVTQDYWQDVQPPPGIGSHANDAFYQQHGSADGLYNIPQYGNLMPHEEPPFPCPMDPAVLQPDVWQGVTAENIQLSPNQVTVQPFSRTQGVFRLPSPVMGQVPGLRFRHPGPYRTFNHQRPRFPGQMNGPPRVRRPPGNAPIRQPGPQQPQQPLPLPPAHVFRSPQKRPSFDGSNNSVVPLSQVRYDPLPKRKKRMPDMSNLHEVQTVDTLPLQTATDIQDENEDEETREYRKKIEEQKRLRERILQQKEARRKLAALEKQRELQKKDIELQAAGDAPPYFSSQGDPPQGNAIATIVNRNTIEPQTVLSARHNSHPTHLPLAGRSATPIQLSQGSQQNVTVVPAVQTQVISKQVMHAKQRGRGHLVRGRGRGIVRGQVNAVQPQQLPQQQLGQFQQKPQQQQKPQLQTVPTQVPAPAMQKLFVNQAKNETVLVERAKAMAPTLPAPGQRIIRAVQPNAPKRVVLSQGSRVPPATSGRTVMLRGANSSLTPTQAVTQPQVQQQPRRVVQKSMAVLQSRTAGGAPGRTVVSTQATGITVTAQPQEVGPCTKLVAVENLAAGTTDTQLRRMCQRVGPVENIQMIPAQRRAVITFVNPTSAATFMKRYQRKMVDLSLINVTLVVQ